MAWKETETMKVLIEALTELWEHVKQLVVLLAVTVGLVGVLMMVATLKGLSDIYKYIKYN